MTGTRALSTAPEVTVGLLTPYRAVVTKKRLSPGCGHIDVGCGARTVTV
ncbi:hypothetical protein [Streptomyces sp. NPDC002156]